MRDTIYSVAGLALLSSSEFRLLTLGRAGKVHEPTTRYNQVLLKQHFKASSDYAEQPLRALLCVLHLASKQSLLSPPVLISFPVLVCPFKVLRSTVLVHETRAAAACAASLLQSTCQVMLVSHGELHLKITLFDSFKFLLVKLCLCVIELHLCNSQCFHMLARCDCQGRDCQGINVPANTAYLIQPTACSAICLPMT